MLQLFPEIYRKENVMLLSIIIPVYKVEKFIRKTLESICEQLDDLAEVEIIFINDGTPDTSMSIVEEYSLKIRNYKVINQDNSGLSCARNTGIDAAIGDYVWFVDSDDWLPHDAIFNIKKCISQHPLCDVFFFMLQEYNEDGQTLDRYIFPNNVCNTIISGIEFLSLSLPYVTAQTFLYKRSFLNSNKLRFRKGIYHEDLEFMPRVMIKAKKMMLCPIVCYNYLIRNSGSIMSNPILLDKRKNSLLEIIKVHMTIYRELGEYKDSLNFLRGITLRAFWNDISAKDWLTTWKKREDVKCLYPEFKLIMYNDPTMRKGWYRIFKRCIFLFSPSLCKLIAKNL